MKKIIIVVMALTIGLNANLFGQWISTYGPVTGRITDFTTHQGNVFASSLGGTVFMSSDQGINWTQKYQGLLNPYIMGLSTSFDQVYCVGTNVFRYDYSYSRWDSILSASIPSFPCITSDTNKIIAGSMYNGVFISYDSGQTWTNRSSGLPQSQGNYEPLNCLYSDNNSIYAGLNGIIAQSSDDGLNWTYHSMFGKVNKIDGLGNKLFLLTNLYGFHISDDKGKTWIRYDSANKDLKFTKDIIYHRGLLFLSAERSLYISSDSGSTWVKDSFPDSLTFISLGASGNTIYGGTLDGFIWEKDFQFPLSISNQENQSSLSAYPNPADDKITINASVPIDHAVMYNIMGVKVWEVSDINDYSIAIYRDKLPPGLYFLRIFDSKGIMNVIEVVFK